MRKLLFALAILVSVRAEAQGLRGRYGLMESGCSLGGCTMGGSLTLSTGDITIPGASCYKFTGSTEAMICSVGDGKLQILDDAGGGTTNWLHLGPADSTGVVIKQSASNEFTFARGDNGAVANVQTANLTINGASAFVNGSSATRMRLGTDGVATLTNAADTGFTRLNLGGTTSSFFGLAVNGTEASIVAADGSAVGSLLFPDGTYLRMRNVNAGAPAGTDCDATAEDGRIIIDDTNERLYVCRFTDGRGWDYLTFTD